MTRTATATADDRNLLLRIVEEAYRQNTWNGTNLRTSLKEVGVHEAGWRPPHARHNIAEIVLHSAYWKFAVRKRMTRDRQAAFALDGKDWFDVSKSLGDERWASLIAVLDDEHRRLCDAIRHTGQTLRYRTSAGRELVRRLFGVAMHDAYHTGQIHLIQAQYKRAQSK